MEKRTRRFIFDLEANGLLHEADKIWCGVFHDLDTDEIIKATNYGDLLEVVGTASTLIGHNICDYDIPLLLDVLDYRYEGDVYDTFLMSMMVCPDRKKHPDCKKGPHSLENFGCMFGRSKPEHEDWSKFSPEMLFRCEEDVEITTMTWNKLSEEMGIKL